MRAMNTIHKLRGFTLIELLVVLAIVAMLLTLSVPRYMKGLDKAKEQTLIENLRLTREVIDHYYGDTGAYPESLEQLVEKHYLKALPIDPVAESDTAWTLVPPPSDVAGRVYDLHSSAQGASLSGRPYAEL
ncbi:MAG: prepilin-type N-terminal cleavage/methylation domain-containing protein [Paucibacter sp.]|nr:prepilin-type N-terminal cleavage/methylation domain-containing protein [Roseateles sp.]